ncbi:hypothetical protein F4813DRAFT_348860 [Daldinia decipiens]|uniref:uncharacterized protein n=1 Tax=Daldinia decipiens TaxID=326647 RepID=UPI0020C5550A|nr:uncharacterized protein F4813DRAFT_348860 [Daldinia decipiens]KAI1660950.1 hypothetical protein F4813DRAFT_348860 [Daldinia decipiens]
MRHSHSTMLQFNSSSRGLSQGPKTPEPSAPGDEFRLPSPPRPRLKLKRRHVSQHLNAPTQQFLASVAAADVPVPSIEVEEPDSMGIYGHLNAPTFSPPKTPAIEFAPPSETKFPDWSVGSEWSYSDVESSPEYESSRPSTAFSTQTSSSLFSQFSHASEDSNYMSPELKALEFPKFESDTNVNVPHKERSRKAPWTKAMDSHLWSTYMLYLQDPRVTPIRLGRSRIPPNGVCLRVAREAKRSWKGSKGHLTVDMKSGSNTPTAESAKPYIEWPHTCAATRAHLRELCRMKAAASPGRYKSRSPTPFHKAAHRRWNRKSVPAQSSAAFSARDMAFSLAVSTSDTMKLDAPLAQLTSSESEPFPEFTKDVETIVRQALPSPELARLPSPVMAKSYGPSSSSSFVADITPPRQSNSLGSRKVLKSPVRLTRSRSGTQKRRSVKDVEDLPRKRPSLAAAFWKEASEKDDVFTKETHYGEPSTSSVLHTISAAAPQDPFVQPRRLGSPFSGAGSSYSFPNRLSAPINFNLTALRRPFATVQQPIRERSEARSPSRPSLASRLAYLDQRLRELRNRGSDRRRSQSPPS